MTNATRSRRAVLAGAVALPALAAPAALAAVSDVDPIFAAIERHRAAEAAHCAACEAADDDTMTEETADPVLCELVVMTPTTVAGCAALLLYCAKIIEAQHCSRSMFDGFAYVEESALGLLTRIAAVLQANGVATA